MEQKNRLSWHCLMPLTISAVIIGAAALVWTWWGALASDLVQVALKLVVIP